MARSQTNLDNTRLAALLLCKGSLSQLRMYIDAAKIDFRDVIAQATREILTQAKETVLTGQNSADGFQGLFGFRTIRPTGLCHIWPPAAAFSANRSACYPHKIDGRELIRQILCPRQPKQPPCRHSRRQKRQHPSELSFCVIDKSAEIFAANTFCDAGDQLDTANVFRPTRRARTPPMASFFLSRQVRAQDCAARRSAKTLSFQHL